MRHHPRRRLPACRARPYAPRCPSVNVGVESICYQARLSGRRRLPYVGWVGPPRKGERLQLLILAETPIARSERVLERHVVEVAVLVLARLADELAGEEAAVARIALEMTRDVVGGENVGLRADVAGGCGGSRPQHTTTLVVDRVSIRRPPEKVLLDRKREPVDRAEGEPGGGAHDVPSPDVVDIPQEPAGVRPELTERSAAPSGPR